MKNPMYIALQSVVFLGWALILTILGIFIFYLKSCEDEVIIGEKITFIKELILKDTSSKIYILHAGQNKDEVGELFFSEYKKNIEFNNTCRILDTVLYYKIYHNDSIKIYASEKSVIKPKNESLSKIVIFECDSNKMKYLDKNYSELGLTPVRK